ASSNGAVTSVNQKLSDHRAQRVIWSRSLTNVCIGINNKKSTQLLITTIGKADCADQPSAEDHFIKPQRRMNDKSIRFDSLRSALTPQSLPYFHLFSAQTKVRLCARTNMQQ
ncbi:hypothetical protein Tcan_00852, partial [Toxocara canis]